MTIFQILFRFLFEQHFTLVRVKALVLTLTLTRIITILIVVSERVAAIHILVQTGIHFRLFTFFESFEKKRSQLGLYCRVREELSKEYICLTG